MPRTCATDLDLSTRAATWGRVYARMVSAEPKPAVDAGIYGEFDAFLKQGIREYYDRGWQSRKGNFIALLIASGQTTLGLAKDSVGDGSRTKKVANGAAAGLALRNCRRHA